MVFNKYNSYWTIRLSSKNEFHSTEAYLLICDLWKYQIEFYRRRFDFKIEQMHIIQSKHVPVFVADLRIHNIQPWSHSNNGAAAVLKLKCYIFLPRIGLHCVDEMIYGQTNLQDPRVHDILVCLFNIRFNKQTTTAVRSSPTLPNYNPCAYLCRKATIKREYK